MPRARSRHPGQRAATEAATRRGPPDNGARREDALLPRTSFGPLNLRLDIAYDGAPFHGFARQPGLRTVQGDLESAIARFAGGAGRFQGGEISSTCAGRTDAGVHALAQVVGFPGAPDDLDLERLPAAINAICGPSIAVTTARAMPEGWDARFDARSRTYVYAVLEGGPPDPFLARFSWHRPGILDIEAMNEAAGHLVGEHDFSSFGRVATPDASSTRTLFELGCSRSGRVLRVRARANAFIQQMVRSLVGTLVDVGAGKRAPERMPEVLEARDRAAAGAVAPPHGLALVAVEYDEGWAVPPGAPGEG